VKLPIFLAVPILLILATLYGRKAITAVRDAQIVLGSDNNPIVISRYKNPGGFYFFVALFWAMCFVFVYCVFVMVAAIFPSH
jgi:hypothetical protein